MIHDNLCTRVCVVYSYIFYVHHINVYGILITLVFLLLYIIYANTNLFTFISPHSLSQYIVSFCVGNIDTLYEINRWY